MKIKLEVPFYGQREILEGEDGDNGCGIVCVKMVLDFVNEKEFEIKNLIKEAGIIGAQKKGKWSHESLIRILRNNGVLAFSQEFKTHDVDLDKEKGQTNKNREEVFRSLGIEKIKGSIEMGFPVLASVKAGFGKNESDHVILIVGVDENNFYVNDPQRNGGEEQPLEVAIDRFKEYWKGLTIFTEF